MQTILEPFHPDLEGAFVNEILNFKQQDLLCPLLILTPSDLLRRRLKTLLAQERQMALLNVRFLTFHQLALQLEKENDEMLLDLQSDLFFEEALRQMIRSRQRGAEPFAGLEERAGGCAALWQTLRDLRDSLVDPATALEALAEGHFSGRASERTSDLLELWRSFQDFCHRQRLADSADLDRRAIQQAPCSAFLKQFTRIFYYGFYDLTQTQVDFFHAVARHQPTTLFFPLLRVRPSHAAWSFAQRFYERYVQGHNPATVEDAPPATVLPATARLFDDTKNRTYSEFPKAWQCEIRSTFGVNDEVAAAAKEILKLVEAGGMQFHQIGVVARTLEGYGQTIQTIFHQHRIPLAGTLEEPLAQFPLTKSVILLLNLPAKDFLRSQVIDLVSSPYFQLPNDGSNANLTARPDLWDLATRELAICKSVAAWRRLRRYSQRDLQLSQRSDDEEPRLIRIPSAQLLYLAEIVEALIADLLQLPAEASWQEYTRGWKALLKKYLGIAPEAEMSAAGSKAGREILTVLDQLGALDRVEDRVALADFVHTFQHWLERSVVAEDRRNRDGVMVLTATAARGLSFRALFVLGMNEGVFPRTIREDPFLRDRDREVFELDLGYKISQKLAAFDEEKLLFTLLVGAARERLYCSFQRADESGRALAPSWYIDEIKRALNESGRPCGTIAIPRSITEKSGVAPFDQERWLLPSELAIRLTLEGRDPSALIEASTSLPELYLHGRQVAAATDQSSDRLLPYDGALARFDDYWKKFSARGPAPTALETYARCPFQFFAYHVLRLEPLDRPEEVLGPSPAEFGELGHKILNTIYRALIDAGYFAGKAAAVNLETTLLAVAARTFADYEEIRPVGYPLAWESVKDGLVQLLRQVIAQDLAELSNSGYAPASLETEVTGRLPADWPQPLKNLAIRGRMDRIDRKDDALRVIDYKFKFGANPTSRDKNLIRSAVRGERLQPPFYYMLAQHWAETQHLNPATMTIEADFYYIAPRWSDGPLLSAPYRSELGGRDGAAVKRTIAYLADGIRQGRFFINRGAHCSQCDAAPICRKNHPPSLWRAENDPTTETHRALRARDPEDDERETD